MTDVVRLGRIVAVFAALRAKSAVDKFVVHKIMFAWTKTRAPNTQRFRITRHRHHRRRIMVVICLPGVRPVALVVSVVMIFCSAVALTTMDYQFAGPIASINLGDNPMKAGLVVTGMAHYYDS
uniref:Putative sugar phosphate isomerases/epimerase n=1 Tax=uncultured bacterium RM57 TaxID=561246 RepID=C8XTA0_9BACT|nr:putative sugar phosphate isomerases/epimerase [uncultured bacterium RM57]